MQPLLLFLTYASCCPFQEDQARVLDTAFSIRATVIEALEGGPVVVNVTLTYQGKQPIKVVKDWFLPSVTVEAPPEWKARGKHVGVNGMQFSNEELKPGDKWSETLFLHQDYDSIPSGKRRFTLSWPLYAPSEPIAKKDGEMVKATKKLLVRPTTILHIDILPATAARITNLCNRLQRRLNEPKFTAKEAQQLADTILDTRHPELVPVAWQMLEATPSPSLIYPLIRHVDNVLPPSLEVLDHFVKLACGPNWEVKHVLFDRWRVHPPSFTPDQMQQLATADNIWTSVRAYVTFPTRYDVAKRDALFARLRDLNQPLPEAAFDRLLRCLDDDDFKVREKATAALEAFGERVEGHLSRCLNQSLSPEVERRVRLLLETIAEAKQPPECLFTLEYLGNTFGPPESKRVLEILAQASRDTWLKQTAKAVLENKKKRFSPPRD